MRNRIIIGKTDNTLYCLIRDKKNQRKEVIEATNNDTKRYISYLLDVKIKDFRMWNNLLVVKTNDDLIVIEDYLQINHDKVFKNFNKRLSTFTVRKLGNRNLTLEKKNNHRRASIGAKALCCAALFGILILPVNLDALTICNNEVDKVVKNVVGKVNPSKPQPVVTEQSKVIEQSVVVEEVKPDPQEEYFKIKVKEYSEMYFIDYDRALKLIEENKERIKNDYINEEVGIIRILAEEFYKDSNISKKVEISDMSHLKREKLLLKFAKVYGITDIDIAATILAVYRLETGNGESEACLYRNNFGGLRGSDMNGNYYVMTFKTPEIGAEAMINSFINIKNRAMTRSSYNPSRSLEQNINPIYCGESSWPRKVRTLKNEVMNEYNLGEYVNEEKPKQLIK